KENDQKMMEDMYGWMEQILRACDAEIVPFKKYLEPMGDATHECGSARMGTDPKKSALNSYCQSHDVKNLFVTDGSCFVSLPGTWDYNLDHGLGHGCIGVSGQSAEERRDLETDGSSPGDSKPFNPISSTIALRCQIQT